MVMKRMIGAGVGAVLGGPLGALVGWGVGGFLEDNFTVSSQQNASVRCTRCNAQLTLVDGDGFWECAECHKVFYHGDKQKNIMLVYTMIMAKLAKADGVISNKEIDIVNAHFDKNFSINSKIKEYITHVFNEEKIKGTDIDTCMFSMKYLLKDDMHDYLCVLDTMFAVSSVDGAIHPEQKKILITFKRICCITDSDYSVIQERYAGINCDTYYLILGCKEGDSIDEIKKAYRKMVQKYHPDTIAGKDLDPVFLDFAKREFCKVQEAYEKIKVSRKIS